MKVLKFTPPVDRVAAETELLEKLHATIGEYAGVLTVVQAVGLLEACKLELIREHS